jgi:hypothetical protein
VGAYHLRGSHLKLIARQHARYSVRGGAGLVFMFFTLAAGLFIAGIFIDMVSNVKKANDQQGQNVTTKQVLGEVVNEIGRPAVKWAIQGDNAQVTYMVDEKPALVSAIMIVLMFALPFLVGMGSFNQLSGDIGSKGLRYLLPRTERPNLFIGRFIGTYVFVLVTLAILMGAVLLYTLLGARYYSAGDVIPWMLRCYVAMAFLALPYVAFCSWFSAMIDMPFGTFALTQAVIGLLPVFVALLPSDIKWAKYINYAMPWPWKYRLLHPDFGQVALASGAMLGYTAIFLFLGLRYFQKRDL